MTLKFSTSLDYPCIAIYEIESPLRGWSTESSLPPILYILLIHRVNLLSFSNLFFMESKEMWGGLKCQFVHTNNSNWKGKNMKDVFWTQNWEQVVWVKNNFLLPLESTPAPSTGWWGHLGVIPTPSIGYCQLLLCMKSVSQPNWNDSQFMAHKWLFLPHLFSQTFLSFNAFSPRSTPYSLLFTYPILWFKHYLLQGDAIEFCFRWTLLSLSSNLSKLTKCFFVGSCGVPFAFLPLTNLKPCPAASLRQCREHSEYPTLAKAALSPAQEMWVNWTVDVTQIKSGICNSMWALWKIALIRGESLWIINSQQQYWRTNFNNISVIKFKG